MHDSHGRRGVFALAGRAEAAPPLYTPWPCGVTYEITQGHNTGSHTGNGAWAWDVGIPVGFDVTAPADGFARLVKMDSNVGGCSSAYGNDANYVIIDFGDGTEALLLHLEQASSTLSVGDFIQQGDVVGRVGLTGWVCGAHLHLQIQQTCSSWWCPSVPAAFVDLGDPSDGATLVSNNCPITEPCTAVADGGETVIDEETACFVRQTSYWWSVPEGWLDHHWYTKATDAPAPETIGTWLFDVATAGTYRVDVFVPDTDADSTAASYVVDGGAGPQPLGSPIDQTAQKGWVTLGEVDLAVGSSRYVELGDNTGEPVARGRHLAYDAVRLTFVPPPAGATSTGSGDATGAGPGTTAAAGGDGAGEGGQGGGGEGASNGGEGCDCRSAPGRAGAPSVPLAVLGLLVVARGRGRRQTRLFSKTRYVL